MPVMTRHALQRRHEQTSKDEPRTNSRARKRAARSSTGIEKLASAIILKIAQRLIVGTIRVA